MTPAKALREVARRAWNDPKDRAAGNLPGLQLKHNGLNWAVAATLNK